jgi:transposase
MVTKNIVTGNQFAGVGVVSLCLALSLATVANPRDFKNGRQMATWTGLVPCQNSSGGKQRLGVITKRGDRLPARTIDPRGALNAAACGS